MPDSVRSRYERRWVALRAQSQEKVHPDPLDAFLMSVGAYPSPAEVPSAIDSSERGGGGQE